MDAALIKEVYRLLQNIRSEGVKMKEIAKFSDLHPSVLSALYSTVLPTYIEREEAGDKEPLDYALSLVNNLSKKRFNKILPELKEKLIQLDSGFNVSQQETFFHEIWNYSMKSENIAPIYLGQYISYSLSSARDALKIEPILLKKSDQNSLIANRISAYGIFNEGMAISVNNQNLYICLNESQTAQPALVSYFMQLPFYENAIMIRGLYLALDYNRNPIARRVVYVKVSDSVDEDEFRELEGRMVEKEEIKSDQKLLAYYNYVSDISDSIRMFSIPQPKFNEEDFIVEKKLLSSIK